MTHDDDLLDSGTAERLTAGSVSPADAPPGYAPVAALLASAAVPGPVPDLDFDALARVARRTADHSGSSKTRRSPMLGKLLTLKAAAAAGVILIGASGAAAATGSLPRSVQSVAHDTLSHVGVDVPDDTGSSADDHSHQDGTPGAADPTTTTTTGADGSVPPVVTPGSGEDSHGGTTVQDPATEPGDNSPGGTQVGDDSGADGSGDHSGASAGSGDDGGDHQPVPTTVPGGSGGTGGSGDHSGSGSGDHSGSGSGSGDTGSGGGSGSGSQHG